MNRFLKATTASALAMGLSACSTVQSWFPDKQKEYRYSTEIPPLEIPPNLVGTMDGPPGYADEPPEPVPAAAAAGTAAAGAAPPSPAGAIADSPIGKYRPSPVGAELTAVLAKDSTSPHIAIEAPFPNAWTMVDKAINRLRLEIKDKNRSQKVLYVYYSENAKPFEPSWSDDLLAPFGGSKHRDDEREYQVRLEDLGDVLTKVRVFDGAGEKAQAEGEGYQLLQLIQKKIVALSEPEPDRRRGETTPENERPGDEEDAP
ncbi:outer membrane protein assembly factor BamC [Methylogaea oryzae]|nr:outer membrane protein assembly factor BamC [Methylogaea oryzae]